MAGGGGGAFGIDLALEGSLPAVVRDNQVRHAAGGRGGDVTTAGASAQNQSGGSANLARGIYVGGNNGPADVVSNTVEAITGGEGRDGSCEFGEASVGLLQAQLGDFQAGLGLGELPLEAELNRLQVGPGLGQLILQVTGLQFGQQVPRLDVVVSFHIERLDVASRAEKELLLNNGGNASRELDNLDHFAPLHLIGGLDGYDRRGQGSRRGLLRLRRRTRTSCRQQRAPNQRDQEY